MHNACLTVQNKVENTWLNKAIQPMIRKHSSPGTQKLKKYPKQEESTTSKTQASYNARPSDRANKQKTHQIGHKHERSNFGAFFRKDKAANNKRQSYSPKATPLSPKKTQINLMRTTIKSLVQKTPRNHSFHSERGNDPNFAQHRISKPIKILEKENEILREENHMLKHELSEIKRHLMIEKPSKRQEIISNLRDTIKKEDAAIQELKLKLDISHKKIQSLTKMMESKDEEIDMWMHKADNLERQMENMRERNSERIDVLKEKTNLVIRSYNELERKMEHHEKEWLLFQQSWAEEKSIYTHRIQFLESYISTN